jgi:hypothetical protein
VAGEASGGSAGLIGRQAELVMLEQFLGSGATPCALVLTGGPGISKTALWEAGLFRAGERVLHVLAARSGEAEARHSFAALFDLLEGVSVGTLGALPVPQRRALEAAVLRSEPEPLAPAEPFAVAAGFLGVLRCLAADRPLLLAVDDLQWLDAASAGVLVFAARRLRGAPCRFLLARRSGRPGELERALSPAGMTRIEVGPLSMSSTYRLLSQSLGLALPRRTLSHLFEVTHGNPLLVLELGRTLAAGGRAALGADLPTADLAGNPFGTRVAGLARPARRALLAVALGGQVSLGLLHAVADPAAVEDIVAAGLLITEGWRVRAVHPLLAAAARRQSSARQRRALHLDLADSSRCTRSRSTSPGPTPSWMSTPAPSSSPTWRHRTRRASRIEGCRLIPLPGVTRAVGEGRDIEHGAAASVIAIS